MAEPAGEQTPSTVPDFDLHRVKGLGALIPELLMPGTLQLGAVQKSHMLHELMYSGHERLAGPQQM